MHRSFWRTNNARGLTDAEPSWQQVVELRERLGDRQGTMVALERLASLRRTTDQSESHWLYRRALSFATELRDKETEARIRNSLAVLAWQGGELDEAEKQYGMAAAIIRRDQNTQEVGVVLNGLGVVLTKLDRAGEGWALQRLSEVSREAGERQKADAYSAAAMAIGREIGDKELESLASKLQSPDHTSGNE